MQSTRGRKSAGTRGGAHSGAHFAGFAPQAYFVASSSRRCFGPQSWSLSDSLWPASATGSYCLSMLCLLRSPEATSAARRLGSSLAAISAAARSAWHSTR